MNRLHLSQTQQVLVGVLCCTRRHRPRPVNFESITLGLRATAVFIGDGYSGGSYCGSG